ADEGIAERGEELFALSAGELALVSVLSFDLRYFSLLAFGPALFPFVPGVAELAVFGGVVLAAMLGVGLWALSAAVTFARYYGFRLAQVGDELRYERGLLERYDGSIPMAKVQTLSMGENVLMRRFGYATLAVETAGYGPGQSPSQGSEAAVPLAARERVVSLAREIEPFDGAEFSRPPKRARTRYAFRYVGGSALLVAVLYIAWSLAGRPLVWYAPFAPLAFVAVAPLAAHLKWANRGYATGENHVFTRNGFWNRTTKVVPYYRVQNVIETQTVFQRRRRLASVLVDTASSAGIGGRVAAAVDLDAEDAAELRELVGEKLQASLAARRPDDGSRRPDSAS
ncbi:PH domain-containing protein, partial [Halorussus sp. GCM10023401]